MEPGYLPSLMPAYVPPGPSDESLHPFAKYNKQKGTPQTLVGNWNEERALLANTGVNRYEPWVKNGEAQTIYAERAEGNTGMDTFPRVLEHLDQTAAADWRSSQKAAYQDPKHTKTLQEFKGVPTLGRRAQQELAALMQEAAHLPDEVEHTLTGAPVPLQHETTYVADFVEKDMTGIKPGARVMRDPDGRPAVRDPTFLAETQIVPKAAADRVFGDAAKAAGATQTVLLPNPDIPITVYSEAVATRKYGSSVYGTRPIAGTLPFNKNTNFSKPMSEYNKVVVDE